MFKCKYCDKEFDNVQKAAAHTKWCKNNPERGKGTLKTKHRYCVICGKEIFWSRKNRKRTCDNECCIKENRKHTEEYKKYMSEKRKEWLRNNPNKHPWKNNNKFISKPCEMLKKILQQNNIRFEEEFSPIENRFFSIDIFIPSKNIGLEINGNQHYTAHNELKKYYHDRHNMIIKEGIKLLEIHYAMVYNENFINDLICFIKGTKEINVNDYKKDIRLSKRKIIIEKQRKAIEIKNIKIQERINTIKNIDIDFSKFGWNKKVANKLQISQTQVRRFMKKYMPNFYSKCYVRKSCKNN